MGKRSFLVTENVFFFPEEIIYEILSWLEVKSLLICKSVCKVWNAVINNNQFVDMHAIRSNGGEFYNIEHTCKIPKSFGIKGTLRYLCISHCGFALVIISSSESALPSEMYRISNPTTKRILDLPRPHEGVISMTVFQNSSTGSYNVVSVYYDKENEKDKLELIDLGGQSNEPCADLSWRSLNITEFDKVSRPHGYYRKYLVSNEGVLYILALHTVEPSNHKIICVDLVEQACTTFYAPQNLSSNCYEVNFQFWRGKPSVVFLLEEKINVWMLEDYKKQKWADSTIVIPLPCLKGFPLLEKVVPYLYCGDEEDLLIFYKCTEVSRVYKLKSKQLCYIPSTLLRVPATLVSVKGMQPEKKAR